MLSPAKKAASELCSIKALTDGQKVSVMPAWLHMQLDGIDRPETAHCCALFFVRSCFCSCNNDTTFLCDSSALRRCCSGLPDLLCAACLECFASLMLHHRYQRGITSPIDCEQTLPSKCARKLNSPETCADDSLLQQLYARRFRHDAALRVVLRGCCHSFSNTRQRNQGAKFHVRLLEVCSCTCIELQPSQRCSLSVYGIEGRGRLIVKLQVLCSVDLAALLAMCSPLACVMRLKAMSCKSAYLPYMAAVAK